MVRTAAWSAALGLIVMVMHAGPSLSQSAIGGSVGKQDKSISGGGDEGGSSRSTSHERERERERERPSRSERSRSLGPSGSGGGGANYDGQWAVASVGTPCGAGQAAMAISGSRIVSNTFSGSVSGGGSITGTFSASGKTGRFHGHLSRSSGSGSFSRSDGCAGSFSMVKQ